MLFYTMKNTDMLQLYAIEFHANVFRVIFLHKCSSRFVLVVHFAPLPLYTYKQLYMCISRYPFCSGGPFRPTLPNTHINMYKSICVHCIRSLGSTEDNWTKKVKYGDVQWSSHERAGSRPLSALPFSLGPFHASSLKAMPIMSIDSRPVAFVSSLRGKLAPPPPPFPPQSPVSSVHLTPSPDREYHPSFYSANDGSTSGVLEDVRESTRSRLCTLVVADESPLSIFRRINL